MSLPGTANPVGLNVGRFSSVAILSTGTEILQGLYADTNARYLSEQVSLLGMSVTLIAAAPDDSYELEQTLRHLCERADLVICSGGLGPTEDDVNREVFARVFGVELVRDQQAVDLMRARFRDRFLRAMPVTNEVQAMVPAGCEVFQNEWGTAPGFFLPPAEERNLSGIAHCGLIALPGPPREMIPMFEKHVRPLLRARSAANVFVRTTTVHTFGRPESQVNEAVRELFRRDPNVIYTVLAKTYGVDIRITARTTDEQVMEEKLNEYVNLTYERLGHRCIYGHDETTMAEAVARLLIEQSVTITAAESCTGGLLAKLLTDVSGSSAYLKESNVTYSNEAKAKFLGVQLQTLEKYGAVSRFVAREMAEGARLSASSDYAIAVTGIAGPTGGTPEKPVGLTYIALSGPRGTRIHKHRFLGERKQNRLLAALAGLNMLRLELLRNVVSESLPATTR